MMTEQLWQRALARIGAAVTLTAVLATSAAMPTMAATLDVVQPAMECESLVTLDFTGLEGAPARIDSAEIVSEGEEHPFCKVNGYVASDVRFEVRLPVEGWTQRFLMMGCGGYCGGVNAASSAQQAQTAGCAPLTNGEFVTASSDLGHTRNAKWFPDGMWALNNPGAVVDFAYGGMHKTTLLTKALIEAYYGQAPAYSYFVGCSDGGREALQEAQRYPEDFDGIVAGAPVIDEVTTNTVYHAWGIRTNTGADGGPILTLDKIPALHDAAIAACGDEGGLIQDPRACSFDPAVIQCSGADEASCLTAEQVDVVRKLYEGPRTEDGTYLSARAMPVGSELAWIGTMVPRDGVTEMSHLTLGDGAWSFDFPNYMSSFDAPTGITYANMEFTKESFENLHQLSGIYDPTNPDLSAFADNGGKLILWTGWADSGASPYMALNYYNAVRQTMGEAADKAVTFYGLPGVYHCNNGPTRSREDFLTPLMAWVEDGIAPDEVIVEFLDENGEVARSRPAYPNLASVAYDGSGDLTLATSYSRVEPDSALPQSFDWIGMAHYTADHTMWCEMVDGAMICE